MFNFYCDTAWRNFYQYSFICFSIYYKTYFFRNSVTLKWQLNIFFLIVCTIWTYNIKPTLPLCHTPKRFVLKVHKSSPIKLRSLMVSKYQNKGNNVLWVLTIKKSYSQCILSISDHKSINAYDLILKQCQWSFQIKLALSTCFKTIYIRYPSLALLNVA